MRAIQVLITLIIGIMGMVVTTNVIGHISINTPLPPTYQAIVDILPEIWGVTTVGLALGILFGGQAIYRVYKWNAFGNRLKEAYAAKFGGRNPAFDSEVDTHIKAVRAMSRSEGGTKDVNLDWLKRMAKFVEVTWAVPVEEHLSEIEKTELYESDRAETVDEPNES